MRFLPVLTGLAFGLYAAAAMAGAPTEIPNNDPTRICESPRLTANERKECHALFKAATTDTARQDAYCTFDERIYGPAVPNR